MEYISDPLEFILSWRNSRFFSRTSADSSHLARQIEGVFRDFRSG